MIAIITARGGSKGLPGKNTKDFLGKPLIAHTIQAAKASRAIERVIVSTDDELIASVSRRFGADVPFIRPPELATDTATSRDVLLHALNFLEAEQAAFDAFCVLQPTSPLRSAQDIDAAAEIFGQKKANSVLSVVSYEHPIQWAMQIEKGGHILPDDDFKISQRQGLVTYHRPNGAIYLFRKDFFKRFSTYIGDNSFAYVMPPERSFDIDTDYDFVAAEAVGRYLLKNSRYG